MATLHVEPTTGDYPTIQAAANASASGDTVIVHPGVYPEAVTIPQRTDVAFMGMPGAILDGGGTLGTGFYAFNASTVGITIDGFEIRNYKANGVVLAGGLAYALTRHKVTNLHVHHIIGPTANSYGVWLSGGNPLVRGNKIHDVGWYGESTGIWAGNCHDHVIDRNWLWNVRKEGVRDFKGLRATITNNFVVRAGMAGYATNQSVSPLVANNVASWCTHGINPKHVNTGTSLSYWNREDPASILWGRFWHNTLWRSANTSLQFDGNASNGGEQTKVDARNNIFGGRGGMHLSVAILAGNPRVIDYNVYDTSDPAGFVYHPAFDSYPSKGKTLEQVRTDLGYELNGSQLNAGLIDPLHGQFDYPDTSPVIGKGTLLPSEWGSQVGARGVQPVMFNTPVDKVAINAKSKGYGGAYLGHTYTTDDKLPTYLLTGNPPGTNAITDEWIIYDLGSSKTFNAVNLTVYAHAMPYNVKRWTVETSENQVDWTLVLDFPGTDSNLSAFPISLDAPATGRYVRFTAKSNFNYSYDVISDFQVGVLSSERRLSVRRVSQSERRAVKRRSSD